MNDNKTYRTRRAIRKPLLERLFPERQFIYRRAGKASQITVSRHSQIAMSLLGSMGLMWVGYATVSNVMFSQVLQNKNLLIQSTQDAYRQAMDDLSTRNRNLALMASEMEEFKTQLRTVASLNKELDQKQSGSGGAVRDELAKRLVVLNRDLSARSTRISNRLKDAEALYQSDLLKLRQHNDALSAKMYQLSRQMRESESVRESAQKKVLVLSEKLEMLETRMRVTKLSNKRLLSRLDELTDMSLGNFEDALQTAGLPVPGDDVNGQGPKGGPFIPIRTDKSAATYTPDETLEEIDRRTARVRKLGKMVLELPLSQPLKSYTITSGYGKRLDPVKQGWANHEGLDLGAPEGTPVVAPGPGKVVFAGARGAYGLLVEIKHANGLTTRYAHLSKILVKPGQNLKTGARIGLVGSTGRSTGPHLHYEISRNGKTVNPLNFIEAGKNVFKS